MRRFTLILLGILMIGLFPQSGQSIAQSETQAFEQASLDILYQVDGETITAWFSAGFTHTSGMITWLLPVPDSAEIILESDTWLLPLLIEGFTEPEIEPPYNKDLCKLSLGETTGDGYLPFPEYIPTDTIRYEILTAATLETDTTLSQADWAVVSDYAEQGYRFVRLYLTPPDRKHVDMGWNDVQVNRSPLIRVTYTGNKLVAPLQLHAPELSTHLGNYDRPDVMPVTVHILANTPYLPTNYERVTVDLNTINGGYNLLRSIHDFELRYPIIFFNTLDPQYYTRFFAAQAQVSQPSYVLEAITPPQFTAMTQPDWIVEASRVAADFNERYSHLTRIRTFLHEGQSLPDMILAPAPNEPLFRTDLTTTADSAYFFGCTTETLIDNALLARLPEGRTYLEDWHLHVAHPVDWVMSTLDDGLLVFAPEAVTFDNVKALEEGDPTLPPMLVLQQVMVPVGRYGAIVESLGWVYRDSDSPATTPQYAETLRYDLAVVTQPSLRNDEFLAPAIHAIVMAPTTDWEQHEALYRDMLAYLNTYAYYTHSALQHSLILGDIGDALLVIGYPYGWITRFEPTDGWRGVRWIWPQSTTPDTVARVQIIGLYPESETMIAEWADVFEVAVGADLTDPIAFKANGREGWVISALHGAALIEVSALIDYEILSLLRIIIESIQRSPMS